VNRPTHLRRTRHRAGNTRPPDALRLFLGLTALTWLPSLVVIVLVSRTSAPDLFDLSPKDAHSSADVLLAWYDLERAHHALKEGGFSPGARMRALGYMMRSEEQVRDGQMVSQFVLLPDKGNALHPAHRFGDRMIEVQLPAGNSVRFSEGTLVWVWGTLKALPGNPNDPIPLYQLREARIAHADEAEIPRYFR